jgi:hypothetical protein
MTDQNDGLGAVIAAATLTASRTGELARSSGEVVARRVALGVAGALSPSTADHAEFARMVPEKLEAFTAMGTILRKQSDHVGRELTRLAADELEATARATLAFAGCMTPAALGAAQHGFVVAWFERAAANLVALGMLTLNAQEAAMAPLHAQVAENVGRLSE